jgi:hypothetical protein
MSHHITCMLYAFVCVHVCILVCVCVLYMFMCMSRYVHAYVCVHSHAHAIFFHQSNSLCVCVSVTVYVYTLYVCFCMHVCTTGTSSVHATVAERQNWAAIVAVTCAGLTSSRRRKGHDGGRGAALWL